MTTPLHARRIWLGPTGPGAQTRLFRRDFTLDAAPASATLRVFAEMRYNVWVNGVYLGRGPVFRHPHHLVLDPYDVAPLLRAGVNAIAAVVHTPNLGVHNGIPTGHPGLVAELRWTAAGGGDHRLVTDAQWRASDRSGWQCPSPKRCWALGFVEVFDAAGAEPPTWREPGFDAGAWAAAEAVDPLEGIPGATVYDRPLPDLRYAFIPPRELMRFEAIASPVEPTTPQSPIARQLMEAERSAPAGQLQLRGGALDPATGGGIVNGLTGDIGAALHVDLGRYAVGQPVIDVTSESGGVIDLAWAETLADGRPSPLRKGVSYVDRIHAAPGVPVRWHPIGFSGMRYLTLVLRGFTGGVRIERLGVVVSEPDLPWQGSFRCEDGKLNAIFDLCVRSIRYGTQEGLMDCPTREQAPYVGDGHPVAEWLARLTGDTRHWAYLVREQFARVAANGLIRSTPFSWRDDTLIDYTLIAILGTRDYLRFTGDAELVRDVLPAARGVLQWFDRQRNSEGLFGVDWREMPKEDEGENRYDPARPRIRAMNLFIDHPGLGWHNPHEPGIDRRGVNCAINALWARTLRAMAELEEAAGDPGRAPALRAQADDLAQRIREAFYDPERRRFVDGVCDGERLAQVSQQTNTWAIQAGACDDAAAKRLIRELITDADPALARCGPYFWSYLFPEMIRLGLHAEALEAARRLWWPMLEGGASCLWETFAGDDLDSWCHPWSAAPLPLLLSGIAGLPERATAGVTAVLRPRTDLLAEVEATASTAVGKWSIGWRRDGEGVRLYGEIPEGCRAELRLPDGRTKDIGQGSWQA